MCCLCCSLLSNSMFDLHLLKVALLISDDFVAVIAS